MSDIKNIEKPFRLPQISCAAIWTLVIQEFSRQAVALYQQINNNEKENQTLNSLRYGLLFKLMMGEIDL